MAIGADDCQVTQSGPTRTGSVAERLAMMDVSKVPADLAVDFQKVKSTTGHLAPDSTVPLALRLLNLGVPEPGLPRSMPRQGKP